MLIYCGTFIPYEFKAKEECLRYVIERAQGIKKSLRFIEIDNEHLTIRCPLSGDYLEIVGKAVDVMWVHNELRRRQWYRT